MKNINLFYQTLLACIYKKSNISRIAALAHCYSPRYTEDEFQIQLPSSSHPIENVTTLGSQCYTLNKFDNKSVVLLLKGISILKVSGSNNSTSVLTTSTRTMREDKTQQGSSIFVILETRLQLKPTGLTVCPDRFQSPPFILGADQLVFRAKTRNDR